MRWCDLVLCGHMSLSRRVLSIREYGHSKYISCFPSTAHIRLLSTAKSPLFQYSYIIMLFSYKQMAMQTVLCVSNTMQPTVQQCQRHIYSEPFLVYSCGMKQAPVNISIYYNTMSSWIIPWTIYYLKDERIPLKDYCK